MLDFPGLALLELVPEHPEEPERHRLERTLRRLVLHALHEGRRLDELAVRLADRVRDDGSPGIGISARRVPHPARQREFAGARGARGCSTT